MRRACRQILCVEMAERFTFYTLYGTSTNVLNQLFKLPSSQGVAISNVFNLLAYASCCLGGWLADSLLGRFWTIISFACLYAIGTFGAALSVFPSVKSLGLFYFSTLGLVALSTGAIKPNVCNFGADQFREDEDSKLQGFFTNFYASIQVGCFFAFGYTVNLATNPSSYSGGVINQPYGFFASLSLAAFGMAAAVALFLSGVCSFKRKPAEKVAVLTALIFWLKVGARRSARGLLGFLAWVMMPVFLIMASITAFVPDNLVTTIGIVSAGFGAVVCSMLLVTHLDCEKLIPADEDDARNLLGSELDLTRDEVVATLKNVPVLLLANVLFFQCYNGMNSGMARQACQMDLRLPGGGSQVNGQAFSLGDSLVILLFTPLFEGFLYPFLQRKQGGAITMEQRCATGLAMGALSNALAIGAEVIRQRTSLLPPSDGLSNCFDSSPDKAGPMSAMSAFWMLIPIGFVGLGEILIMPALYYYAYTGAPEKTRSVTQAFNLLCCGSVSGAFTSVTSRLLLPNDFNTQSAIPFYEANVAAALLGIVCILVLKL